MKTKQNQENALFCSLCIDIPLFLCDVKHNCQGFLLVYGYGDPQKIM